MRNNGIKGLSWEECDLLKYELHHLHNDLIDCEIRLSDNDLIVSKIHNLRQDIQDLIYLLKTQKVIS